MRAYSASRSSSLDLELLGRRPTARRARSTLTAFMRLHLAAPRRTSAGSCPVACSHWSMRDALGLELLHGVLHAAAAGRPCTIDSGGSMSTSSASAVGGALDELVAGLVELAGADALGAARRATPRRSRTRRGSRRPTRRSSSGSTSLLHLVDGDGEVGRLARCRSGVAVNVSSSPARGADAARRRSRRRPSPCRPRTASPRC